MKRYLRFHLVPVRVVKIKIMYDDKRCHRCGKWGHFAHAHVGGSCAVIMEINVGFLQEAKIYIHIMIQVTLLYLFSKDSIFYYIVFFKSNDLLLLLVHIKKSILFYMNLKYILH